MIHSHTKTRKSSAQIDIKQNEKISQSVKPRTLSLVTVICENTSTNAPSHRQPAKSSVQIKMTINHVPYMGTIHSKSSEQKYT